MKVAFLACPYSGTPEEIQQRMEKFCKAVARLRGYGKCVIGTLFMHFVLPYDPNLGKDWAYWKETTRELISRADEVYILCLDGWENSTGIKGEIEIAKELNRPIEELPASFAD